MNSRLPRSELSTKSPSDFPRGKGISVSEILNLAGKSLLSRSSQQNKEVKIKLSKDLSISIVIPSALKVFHTSSWLLARARCILIETQRHVEFPEFFSDCARLCTQDSNHHIDYLLTLDDEPLTYIQHHITLVPYKNTSLVDSTGNPLENLDPSCFEVLAKISGSSRSKIFLVRLKSDGLFYALKQINKRSASKIPNIAVKLEALSMVEHEFIVKTKCIFETELHYYKLLEFASRSTLKALLDKAFRFTEREARFYISEILAGLQELHARGISFNSLKLSDVLIGEDGHVRLSSCDPLERAPKTQIDSPVSMRSSYKSNSLMNSPSLKKSHSSSPLSTCHTMVRAGSFESDYLRLGLIAHELLTGVVKYRNPTKNLLNLGGLSENCKDFVKRLIERVSPDKLGATGGIAEIMNHPWLQDIDFENLKDKSVTPPYMPSMVTERLEYYKGEVNIDKGQFYIDENKKHWKNVKAKISLMVLLKGKPVTTNVMAGAMMGTLGGLGGQTTKSLFKPVSVDCSPNILSFNSGYDVEESEEYTERTVSKLQSEKPKSRFRPEHSIELDENYSCDIEEAANDDEQHMVWKFQREYRSYYQPTSLELLDQQRLHTDY